MGLEKIIEPENGDKPRKISFKEKTVQNILNGIEASKQVPFERFIFALGIRNVGETVAKKLAFHFGNIKSLASATIDDLTKVDEIGEVIAKSVIDFFYDANHLAMIEVLKLKGIQMEVRKDIRQSVSNKLEGKSIVVSGNFGSPQRRKEIEQLIEIHGGKKVDAVSASTSLIVAGENIGPTKLEKARKLNIPVITENEFEKMIE